MRLIDEMAEKGLVSPGYSLHLSTAYRILKQAGLSGRQESNPVDRRRFEAEFPERFLDVGIAEQHAITMGLGAFGPEGLGLAVRQTLAPVLGNDWSFSYTQAMPAGGGVTSAADYSRLRVGVGRGDTRRDLADHVLARFEPEEAPGVDEAIARAADAAPHVQQARGRERQGDSRGGACVHRQSLERPRGR